MNLLSIMRRIRRCESEVPARLVLEHAIKSAVEADRESRAKPCDTGKISDGFHTFDELYDHRNHLFIALMLNIPFISWYADKHEDGTMYDGWFIAGMRLPTGDISYHLPLKTLKLLDGGGIQHFNNAPKWDGHTADDVLRRLAAL